MARSKKAKASTKSKKPKTNTKKYAEADMQAAIAEIKANPGVNKKATFIKYNIPPTTGNDRLKGSISREESDKSRRKFNDYEEDCLVEWIRLEASFNKPPTPIVVRRMAEDFYFSIHDKFEKMGQTWLECFVARRPEIAKATGVPIEHLRVVGANKKSINEFFDRLEKIQEEHHFEPQDIFNFDETSIILSRRKNEIVIGASGEKGDPKSIPVVGFSDRESCTVVECCSAAGQRLPAYVIFKGNNVCAHWIANKDFAIEANLTTSFSAESTTLAEPTILAESTTLADETVSGEVAGESTVFAAESTILIDDDTIDSGSVSCDDAVGYNSSSDSDLDSDDETPVHQCSEPNCSDQIVDDSDSFAEFDGDGKTSFEATSAPEEANAGLFDDISRWKLAASRKGWMNASLCLEWLKHFVKHSKSSRSDGKRLLICDGLRAHDAAAFRELCDENNIVLLILPPHCSHVLQPLDLNVFGKVKNKYKSKIGDLVCDKKHKKVIKRAFMIFYGQSRQEHFTPENIRIAWSMSGIVPLNRDKPLNSRLLLDSGEPVVSSESNDEPVLVDSDVDESVNLRTVMDLLTKVKKSGQERGFSLAEMSNVDKLIEIANGGLGGLFEKALESRQKRIQNVNMLNTPPDIRNSIIKPKDGEMDHELGQCWKRTYKK
ncbi:putative intact version of Cirt1 transposase, partial [Candida maltosa Xu316]